MLPPRNVKGIKTFLGMSGFFRKFIKDYAKLAAPLTRIFKNPSDGPSRLVQHNDPNISCLPEKAEVSVNEVTNFENDKILNEANELVSGGHDSIKQAQCDDPTISKVIQWVESENRPGVGDN